jgi:phospholipid transport system substrate-binding protein
VRSRDTGINQAEPSWHRARGLRVPGLQHAAWLAAVIAIAMCASVFSVRIAAGASTDPVSEVRAAIDEAEPVFTNASLSPADRQQKLRDIASRYFDFAYMARSAMGTHCKSLTQAQRMEFVPLFADHVMDTYLGTLKQNTVEAASHGLKDKVTYDGTDRATVYSEVRLPSLADPLAVNYSLRKGDDGWKLYDIVVDNISTMANYRDEFNKTMNDGGYAKLVSDLRSKQQSPAP